jgi:hypothetical protein
MFVGALTPLPDDGFAVESTEQFKKTTASVTDRDKATL